MAKRRNPARNAPVGAAAASKVPPRAGTGRGGRPPGQVRPLKGRAAVVARTRRRNRNLAIGAVVVVVAVVAVVVGIGLSGSGGGAPRQAAPAAAVQKLEGVSLGTLVAAGQKQQVQPGQPAVGSPPPVPAGADPKKPVMLYIGAEFCPICATQRWPLIIALSKFGTFRNLSQTHSAVKDGNIGTWSFYQSTYTSPYLTFDPLELYTNEPSGAYYKPLEASKVTKAQNDLWSANSKRYTPGGTEGFPFIDFAGQWVLMSSQFPDTILQNQSFSTILAQVGNNNSTIGADMSAAAAVLIRDICSVTNDQPGAVCKAPGMSKVPS